MAAAIQLRQGGADVDLVEIDPDWRSYGAGISPGGGADFASDSRRSAFSMNS